MDEKYEKIAELSRRILTSVLEKLELDADLTDTEIIAIEDEIGNIILSASKSVSLSITNL